MLISVKTKKGMCTGCTERVHFIEKAYNMSYNGYLDEAGRMETRNFSLSLRLIQAEKTA